MPWSSRLLYAIAMLLAATPPLLSSRLARSPPAARVETDRAGLTLGTRPDGLVAVTSVRGDRTDRGGLAVGDVLRSIDGRRVTRAAMARRLIGHPRRCITRVDYRRGAAAGVAKLRRCNRPRQADGSRNGAQDTARRG